ncbi:MarR family winged helix-turn-helix transcriptional regulator [Amycolatopsis sp. YIM 10]|uniref:MarR family winged helix-turn-helix transcriptional regulator n=1 Tax=Amycolatopsis sp. YIM 10 TaxID=2653857 RepID=UPI00128FEAA1|nr:MarR family winged helix-turn-helix transcriptional regulator [Amycolatopsis sp. YIM 10]QFU94516.1 MarR family protein [Amycolatopsis sp. YIM 10]
MGPTDDAALELVRQLKVNAQLQQAWTTHLWQAQNGLHPASAWLLAELAQLGESRPSELAKRRMVDVSVVSRQVAQLTAAGLIERRPAPEDGRAALIRVSERGEQELVRWRRQYTDFLTDALSDWEPGELDALTERLKAANESLRTTLDRRSGPR